MLRWPCDTPSPLRYLFSLVPRTLLIVFLPLRSTWEKLRANSQIEIERKIVPSKLSGFYTNVDKKKYKDYLISGERTREQILLPIVYQAELFSFY